MCIAKNFRHELTNDRFDWRYRINWPHRINWRCTVKLFVKSLAAASILNAIYDWRVEKRNQEREQYEAGETEAQYLSHKQLLRECSHLQQATPASLGVNSFTTEEQQALTSCKTRCASALEYRNGMKQVMKARRQSSLRDYTDVFDSPDRRYIDTYSFGPRMLDNVYHDVNIHCPKTPPLHTDMKGLCQGIIQRREQEILQTSTQQVASAGRV
jgi:hypothetical protein